MYKQITLAIAGLLLAPLALAGSLDYSKLIIKDLDEMREMVRPYVNDAETHIEEEENALATEKLREALKTILSRPNSDNMVSKLVPMVRPRLRDLNAFEDTLMGLADEAIYALTKGKESPTLKATNLVVLENMMAEFKPDIENNENVKRVYAKIRDANVQVPKDVKNDLKLKAMFKVSSSPSELAERIIGKPPAEK